MYRIVIILATLVLGIVTPYGVSAKKTLDDAPAALDVVVKKTGIQKTDVATTTGTIIKNTLALVGLLFFILMVYAGIKWMLARGEEDEVTKARETIFGAVIGLAIIISAYAITNFITERVIEQQNSSFLPTSPDSQGDEPLGCCVDWIQGQNDLGVDVNKAYRITTQTDCKYLGDLPEISGGPSCTGPADDCWQFYPGVDIQQCEDKY